MPLCKLIHVFYFPSNIRCWIKQPPLWVKFLELGIFIFVLAEPGKSAFVQVGSGVGLPGEDVVIPLIFSEAPEPEVILGFTITLEISNEFAAPIIDAGSDQPNITAFIDVIEGKFRATGLILAGDFIGNGEIGKLIFSIPPALAAGEYPIAVSNLEVRDYSNLIVPSTAVGGIITVATTPPSPSNPNPTNNQIDVPLALTFDWNDIPEASSYDLYLWRLGQSPPVPVQREMDNRSFL